MMMQQDARSVTSRSGLDRLAAELDTEKGEDGLPPQVTIATAWDRGPVQ